MDEAPRRELAVYEAVKDVLGSTDAQVFTKTHSHPSRGAEPNTRKRDAVVS